MSRVAFVSVFLLYHTTLWIHSEGVISAAKYESLQGKDFCTDYAQIEGSTLVFQAVCDETLEAAGLQSNGSWGTSCQSKTIKAQSAEGVPTGIAEDLLFCPTSQDSSMWLGRGLTYWDVSMYHCEVDYAVNAVKCDYQDNVTGPLQTVDSNIDYYTD